MAFITVEKGNPRDTGKRIVLEENTVLIGRGTFGNDPDINLNDEYISRRHAEISFNQNGYSLRDLNSTNGTSVDQIRIEPDTLYPLKDDSLIGLGLVAGGPRILLRFKLAPTQKTTPFDPKLLPNKAPTDWLKIDTSKNEIWADGKPVTLSRKEYDLVLCLYKKLGKDCHRDELIAAVWPEVIDPGGVSDAAIDQLIRRVRLKIETDPSQPQRIVSHKGFGYRLA